MGKKKKFPKFAVTLFVFGVIPLIYGIIYLMDYLAYSASIQGGTGDDFWEGIGAILGFTAMGPMLLAYAIICLVVTAGMWIAGAILYKRRL